MGSSTVLGQVIGFVALAYVARRVGPANLGDYNFAVSILACFGVLNVGVGVLAIRDIAVDPDRRGAVATETTLLLVGLNGISLVLVLLAAPLIAPSHQAAELLRILAVTFLTSALLLEWGLMGLSRFRWVAVGRIAGQVAYGALVLLLLGRGHDGVVDYAVFNLAGYAVTSVIATGAYIAIGGFARPAAAGVGRLAQRLRRSVPVGFPLVVLQLYLYIDLILLGYLGSARQTGEYAVAGKLPYALTALGMVWGSVLYPHVARIATSELAELGRDLGRAVTFTLGGGALLLSGAAILARPVMTALFGQAYAGAASAFVVLSAAAVLLLADVTLGNALLARGHERQYALAVAVGLAVNAVLDVVLIPIAGAVGPAAATLAVEAGIFAFFVTRVAGHVGRLPIAWSLVARAALAAAGAAALAALLDPRPVAVRVIVFLAAVLAGVLLTGLARRSPWQAAWRAT
ncbi:MAG: oligosaccharide flippase family protein [Solirubrobacteraceae bacterium]